MLKVYRQISIFLANVPGTLAEVLGMLGKANINVLGIQVNDSIDHAVIRMVVDDPTKAAHLLGNNGLLVIEADVIGVVVADKPGALYEVAKKLAKAKVNIAYTYASGSADGQVLIFMRTSDLKKARQALSALFKGKGRQGKGCAPGSRRPKREASEGDEDMGDEEATGA